MQDAHPAAEPAHESFDFDDVAGMNGAAVADPLDPRKKRQALPVLGFGQDQDRADLRDGLGENRRRQCRQLAIAVRQVALVERDVLDPDDPLVHFDFGDAIDEQEGVAMGQDPLDRGVVER